MSKIFDQEIKILFDRFCSNQKFAFSKYADGEWLAIRGVNGTSGNNEWTINDGTNTYDLSRNKLIESFKFKDNDYYVGISCPCCQGEHHQAMKFFSEQNESNLTFANIFVNSNYTFFIENFIPEFNKKTNIHLVANKVTDLTSLPFAVEKFYPVEYDAWRHNLSLINEIKEQNLKDKIFLFSTGPFGNILAYELWKSNKNNVYLDVGSTLDPWTKANRLIGKYYTDNSPDRNKVCVWC